MQQVDYPSALDDVESLKRGRRFYFNQSYRGMWAAAGDLDPESGHIISTALHSLTYPANLDGGDTRSAPQRNADALTDICRFFLDHNDSVETSGGEKPHITVTVDYRILSRELERLPEIDSVAIDPEMLRRLTCDAGIIPMVLGSGSEVLMLAARPARSPQRFDEQWNNATVAVHGRGAPHPHRGPMLTISSTGPMAAIRVSTTSCSCVADTTPRHTRARVLLIDGGVPKLNSLLP